MPNLAVAAKVSKGLSAQQIEDLGLDYYNPENDKAPQPDKFESHSTGAQREKLSSPRYDYMPSRIVADSYARVAAFGASKYANRNWEKGLPQSQIASSLQRHLWAYMDGENTDSDSGLSHLDHVLWNAVALVYGNHHDLCDDRMPLVEKNTESP